jgi:hypothetical protein
VTAQSVSIGARNASSVSRGSSGSDSSASRQATSSLITACSLASLIGSSWIRQRSSGAAVQTPTRAACNTGCAKLPAHDKRRYVKLAWIGLLSVLALPAPAQAEIVAPTAGPGRLAVAPDGSPRVAFMSGRDVVVARRTANRWTTAAVGRAPSVKAVLSGLVSDRRGRTSVLVEAEDGSWLALASRGGKLRVVARPRKGASLGPAGLTLDAAGRPAFAYALRLSSAKTYLRLVTTDARGRLDMHGITKGGFPSSAFVPGAAPVLVRRQLHVVETYTGAAIDWGPKAGGGWEGQFLFASRAGTPAGRVGAVASGAALWSAWTEMTADTLSVLLTLSAKTQSTTTAVEHGIFVSLLVEGGRPEVGAYDWAPAVDGPVYAGVLADDAGPFAELDGRLDGYAAARGGKRQLLLSTSSGLEWFEAPARPAIRVSLSADSTGLVQGRVEGGAGGLVEVFRETAAGRSSVGNAELAPDGSFSVQDSPPASPTLYRAVYVNAATDIPYASLLRTPVG